MAFGQAATRNRIIDGAVATVGVSDRVAFLRRTYGTLGIALLGWALITAGMMRFATNFSVGFSKWAMQGQWSWLIVMLLFMVVGYGAQRLAQSNASRGAQYAGLTLFVVAEALILQPLLWFALVKFGPRGGVLGMDEAGHYFLIAGGPGLAIIGQAALITLAIFIGLTATVFLTKKDFSFMRGALTVGAFAVLGVIIASMIFGFQLGALFCGAVILLMAGYILFQTSLVMREFPPSYHVAAALMLFSTIATLFWYVLQLLISLRGND
jgi:FtsH-binding integral membrane protein